MNTSWKETTRKINGQHRRVAVRIHNGKPQMKVINWLNSDQEVEKLNKDLPKIEKEQIQDEQPKFLSPEEAMKIHNRRDLNAILMDNRIEAKKVVADEEWANHPNTCDYPGVDTANGPRMPNPVLEKRLKDAEEKANQKQKEKEEKAKRKEERKRKKEMANFEKKGQHSAPVRCNGKNEDGSRCENMTTNIPEFCHLHQNQKPGIKRLEKRYEQAKADYHKLGELAMEKGPASFEAEKAYPEAKEKYHELGEKLHKAKEKQKAFDDLRDKCGKEGKFEDKLIVPEKINIEKETKKTNLLIIPEKPTPKVEIKHELMDKFAGSEETKIEEKKAEIIAKETQKQKIAIKEKEIHAKNEKRERLLKEKEKLQKEIKTVSGTGILPGVVIKDKNPQKKLIGKTEEIKSDRKQKTTTLKQRIARIDEELSEMEKQQAKQSAFNV